MAPLSLTRAKSPSMPYHSTENCSKCKFDRLETSSYWFSQIKLAESVGKQFVSAPFFGLAVESKLRRYVGFGSLVLFKDWWLPLLDQV
ncbi:hypothetical protein CFP56_027600 [Quercus suber]|uniref:Uncharacterized protein n=1 Tax=Quercus suber TaxID=58331 RepID=A0AAW0JW29_QUESU